MFDQLILQHGYKTEITPVVVCPCVVHPKDGGKGTPVPNCTSCGGTGRTYPAELKFDTITLPHSIVKRRQFQQPEGELELGTLRVTFLSGIKVYQWDRLLFVDFKLPILEVHKTDTEGKVKLRFYPWEPDAVSILNSDGTSRVLSNSEYTFSQADWTIRILGLSEGVNVSVRYVACPYYYIQSIQPEYRGQPIKQGYPKTFWYDLPVVGMAVRGDLIE